MSGVSGQGEEKIPNVGGQGKKSYLLSVVSGRKKSPVPGHLGGKKCLESVVNGREKRGQWCSVEEKGEIMVTDFLWG